MNRNRWRSGHVCVAPVVAVAEHRAGKAARAVAFKPDDLGLRVQRHIRKRLDAVDEILRHRRLEPLPAHHEMEMLHLRREEHDSLAGGIAAADERNLLTLAELCLHGGGPIGNARAFELGKIRDRRPAVARA